MNENEKRLVEMRTKLKAYKEFDKQLEDILNAKIELEDVSNTTYSIISQLEDSLVDLKIEMNLPDKEWEDEIKTR